MLLVRLFWLHVVDSLFSDFAVPSRSLFAWNKRENWELQSTVSLGNMIATSVFTFSVDKQYWPQVKENMCAT